MRMMREIWALFRLHAAGTYAIVAVTALFFGALPYTVIALRIVLLFVPFVVLLYGGIYTVNGIADRHADALHAIKRLRPVASGRVPPLYAGVLAATCIALALWCSWVLGGAVLTGVFCGFLGLNAAYTFAAKRIPYIELLFNGSTYLLRGIMGAVIAGGTLPIGVGWSLFWTIVGVSAARRMNELRDGHAAARSTLRWYTQRDLLLLYHGCTGAIIAAMLVSTTPSALAAQAMLLFVHALVSYGSQRSAFLRQAAQW